MSEEQGRILVVDDNRMNRIKLSRSLEQQGYAVGLAEGGEQALDMLRAEPFDVVLLDIVMPGMDGYAVLERIKGDAALRDIPVIVISALDEIESAVRCIEMGAEDYLPKSFDPVLLRARLNASLQKKKLRDLEKAYLQQETMLRQSEKMAALGTLSRRAGARAQQPGRGCAPQRHPIARVAGRLAALRGKPRRVEPQPRSHGRRQHPAHGTAAARHRHPPGSIPWRAATWRARSAAGWRSRASTSRGSWRPPSSPWAGKPPIWQQLAASFTAAQKPVFLCWLATACMVYTLLDEVSQGAGRISEIVKAVKSYSYLDQAPVQLVDVHEGIETTLVILRHKLKGGVTVVREYAPDLPRLEAYASELNQVWTNLIDNAIDAMNGHGRTPHPHLRPGQVRRTVTNVGPSSSRSATTGRASRPRCRAASSMPSSPPRSRARGQAWDCTSQLQHHRQPASRRDQGRFAAGADVLPRDATCAAQWVAHFYQPMMQDGSLRVRAHNAS